MEPHDRAQSIKKQLRNPRTRTRSIDQKSNFFDSQANASSSWRTSSIKTPVLPGVRAPSTRESTPPKQKRRFNRRPATSFARELWELQPLLVASKHNLRSTVVAASSPERAYRLLSLRWQRKLCFMVPELPRFAILTCSKLHNVSTPTTLNKLWHL